MKAIILAAILLSVHCSLGRIMNSGTIRTSSNGTKTAAQLFYDQVEPEDRENFIIFHLMRALQLNNGRNFVDSSLMDSKEFEKFQVMKRLEHFSTNLFKWTKDEYELTDCEVRTLVTERRVCFESGKCVNPGDVGSNCCLF